MKVTTNKHWLWVAFKSTVKDVFYDMMMMRWGYKTFPFGKITNGSINSWPSLSHYHHNAKHQHSSFIVRNAFTQCHTMWTKQIASTSFTLLWGEGRKRARERQREGDREHTRSAIVYTWINVRTGNLYAPYINCVGRTGSDVNRKWNTFLSFLVRVIKIVERCLCLVLSPISSLNIFIQCSLISGT